MWAEFFSPCMLCEQSIHKLNRNSVFLSSAQKYPGKIYFHLFPKNKQFREVMTIIENNRDVMRNFWKVRTVFFFKKFSYLLHIYQVFLILATLIGKTLSTKKVTPRSHITQTLKIFKYLFLHLLKLVVLLRTSLWI